MTLAPDFKFSRITSTQNSKTKKASTSTIGDDDLFKHDLLTSLHAIRLGISQIKSGENNLDLITAIDDELAHLMSITEGEFFDKKVLSANDLVTSIKKFFVCAYPETEWRSFFHFNVEEIADKKVCVFNLKQILRNLCANFRENGNQKIVVEFRCDHSFHLKIISYAKLPQKTDTSLEEGKGLRSIRQLLRKSNGFFYFDALEDCVVQELVLPAI